jgi:hypothetical protein
MLPRRSDFFEGRFGRMFRTLPPAQHDIPMLAKLAEKMAADAEAEETPDTEQDAEENNHIPSGYTYLGQFIDHDLTFDPNSSLQKQNDLEALVDFRTPRFDLDCVYGRGPNDQPYMYRDDNLFLFGRRLSGSTFDKNTRDLPRNNPDPLGSNRTNARALIGDPRNDENVIVSQLQGIFMRFHNHVAAEMLRKNPRVEFKDIQQAVRWHYQWVILHDFLPRILDIEVLKLVLPGYKRHRPFDACFKPNLEFFHWVHNPYMPLEFSTAAYRFGHSMVRPGYRLSETIGPMLLFDADFNRALEKTLDCPRLIYLAGQAVECIHQSVRFQSHRRQPPRERTGKGNCVAEGLSNLRGPQIRIARERQARTTMS